MFGNRKNSNNTDEENNKTNYNDIDANHKTSTEVITVFKDDLTDSKRLHIEQDDYYGNPKYNLGLPSTEKKFLGLRKKGWIILLSVLSVLVLTGGILLAFIYPRNPSFDIGSMYVPDSNMTSLMYVPDDLDWTPGIELTSSTISLEERRYNLGLDFGLATDVSIKSSNFVKLKINQINITGQFFDSKGDLIDSNLINISGRYDEDVNIKKRSFTNIITPIKVKYSSESSIRDLLSNPVTELMIDSCGISGLSSSTSGKNMTVQLYIKGSGTMLGVTQIRNYDKIIGFECPQELKDSMQGFVGQVALGLANALIDQTASVISNITSQVLSSSSGSVQNNLDDIGENNNYDFNNTISNLANRIRSRMI